MKEYGDKYYKSSSDYCLFIGRKNGLLYYYFLPLFFKNYHFERKFPDFVKFLLNNYEALYGFFKHLTPLYDEFIDNNNKISEKTIEINEGTVAMLMFFWIFKKTIGKKENEIKCLISLSVKVFEWLGRIEEENENEKNSINDGDNDEEGKKENINGKEMFTYLLLEIINSTIKESSEEKTKIKKDGRLSKILIEIVKNHINNERYLIQKGNKKEIIEYIVYSYYRYEKYGEYMVIDTSDLLSLSSPSFPFSHNTIIYILYSICEYFIDYNNYQLIKKDVFIGGIELLNNYVNITKIINECDIKKEMEKEILIGWNDNIINDICKKISLDWSYISRILSSCLYSFDISSLNNETYNKIERIINLHFNHHSISTNNQEKEIEEENNYDNDNERIILNKKFVFDESSRMNIICYFISSFVDCSYYSIFNVYNLIKKLEEGCNIINIFMKELSGEIVDRIKKREGKNIIEERRRYESERMENVLRKLMKLFFNVIEHTFKDRNNIDLGKERNKEEYKGKKEEMKEDKDYISDLIEEEDIRECLILYLEYTEIVYISGYGSYAFNSVNISVYSNNSLYYLLSANDLKRVTCWY